MTREEAIKVLMYDVSLIISHTIDGTHEKIEQATKCNEAIVLGVDALKNQKTGRWIPVSDRLPEDIQPVIVTWKNNDPKSYYQYIVGKHFIGTAHYHRGKWYWYSSTTEDLLAEYGRCDGEEFDEAIEVVAWMPLPEPCKAESEGKE